MIQHVVIFISGLIGFVGFEALRIYKCLWAKKKIAPLDKWSCYIAVLTAIGTFSGIVSVATAEGSISRAIFIGFSLPCSFKTIADTVPKESEDKVDDFSVEKASLYCVVKELIITYFVPGTRA